MASNEAFAVACIWLYTGLWEELDLLVASCQRNPLSLPTALIADRLEILRLEIVVIIGRCDAACWRPRLHSSQLRSLKTTLEDVLSALGSAVGEHPAASIEQAQDHLFDAIVDQCSLSSAMRTSPPLVSAAS